MEVVDAESSAPPPAARPPRLPTLAHDLAALAQFEAAAASSRAASAAASVEHTYAWSGEYSERGAKLGLELAEVATAAGESAHDLVHAWGLDTLPAEYGGGASAPDPTATSTYLGRPLRGATSGAAYLAAEYLAGSRPPGGGWRYLVGDGADGLPTAVELGLGGGGVAPSRYNNSMVIDPGLSGGAREALKRPSWPDRLIVPGGWRGGAGGWRGLGLAAEYDAAEELEGAHRAAGEAALAGLGALAGR